MPRAYTAREALIRGAAALQGRRMSDLQRECCLSLKISRQAFYATLRGDRNSPRVNEFLSRELGINPETITTPKGVNSHA